MLWYRVLQFAKPLYRFIPQILSHTECNAYILAQHYTKFEDVRPLRDLMSLGEETGIYCTVSVQMTYNVHAHNCEMQQMAERGILRNVKRPNDGLPRQARDR